MSIGPPSIPQLPSENIPLAGGNCNGRSVREIHIDFLLEEEFKVNPLFLDQFISAGVAQLPEGAAGKQQDGPFDVESVDRSVADPFGEADLIVVYRRSEGNGERTAILIEDKIRAEFQPDQPERYRERGEQGKWHAYWTCLVASKRYIHGGADKRFDATITLEQIKEWIAVSDPERHKFKAAVIQEAIEKVEWLGPQQVDQNVTRFRKLYFEYFNEYFADPRQNVYMKSPGDSYKGETWFRIKSRLLQKDAYIHHKAPNGCVDLTFPNTDSDLLKATAPFLEDEMTIEQTGKSSAIRLKVSPIMKFENFELERPKVEQAFAAVTRLLSFYNREGALLHPILASAASVNAK